MPTASFRGDRFSVALVVAGAVGLGLHSLNAEDLPLQPSLRLPGEAGWLDGPGAVPSFLQPLDATYAAPAAFPPPVSAELGQRGWIGDSWVWIDEGTSRLEPPRDLTEAERDFAELKWWQRGFIRVAVLLMVCGAIAGLALLLVRTQRR